jgi:trans-aconitate methyltransferase
MPLPDYADWLTPERLVLEEQAWAQAGLHRRYAAALRQLVQEHGVQTITELGCGTGWVPSELDGLGVQYRGVDRNPHCLGYARRKNRLRAWVQFEEMELRHISPATDAHGVVCAFAVLKHFRLDEWTPLFVQWFGAAAYAAFTIPIAPQPKDDGTEFTHTWVSEEMLRDALQLAGHVELHRDADLIEPLIITRRR